MSHAATTWLASVPPDHITHGEFRVLFHLCDCHNPSMGCFPMQAYLREHTGLSNGGLNKALGELERKGLIRREQERDQRTNRQKPTHYILGFEMKNAQKPSPLSGGGAVSTFHAEPSPLFGGSVSTGVESYTKEEPVKEPVREPCAAPRAPHTQNSRIPDEGPCLKNGHGSAPAKDHGKADTTNRVSNLDTGFDFDVFQRKFRDAYPRLGSLEATEDALREALEAGADPDHILAGARAYAVEQKGNKRQYIAYSENWLAQKRWEQFPKSAPGASDPEVIAQVRAKAIREKAPWIGRHLSPSAARELVARGLVTEEECRAAGVDL